MITYKCDGQSYSTSKKCQNEVNHDLPDWWLIINGKIKNGLFNAHYIEANGAYHFCSRNCLISFLFKDEEELLNAAVAKDGTINMTTDPKEQGQEQEVKQPEGQEQATETQPETLPDAEEGGAQG